MHVAILYLGRENVEIEYLSAVLKAAGHRVSFAYDPGAFSINDNILDVPWLARRFARDDALVAQLVRRPPDLLYAHVPTISFPWAAEIVRRVRERCAVPLAAGGPHPTMAPAAMLEHAPFDYAITGDIEEPVLDLLNVVAGKRAPASVPGIHYREGGAIRATERRPPLANLDALPFPDKELFGGEIDVANDYLLQVGRGCPGVCTYCEQGIFHRRHGAAWVRRRSVANIIAELRVAKRRYAMRAVMIEDPVFFGHRAWTAELLERYAREIAVPFRCYGHLTAMDEATAMALKRAGCYGIEFGYQTANDTLRRDLLERPETNTDLRRVMAICDRVGLRYDLDHIIGLPGETARDFLDAALLYARGRCLNRVKVHQLVYFPDAPLLRTAEELGLAGPEARRQAELGMAGDICRVGSRVDDDAARFTHDWRNFYKLMPLLGGRLAAACAARGWHRLFGALPRAVVIPLQSLVALRGHDRRFWVYTKYFFHRYGAHRRWRRALSRSPI